MINAFGFIIYEWNFSNASKILYDMKFKFVQNLLPSLSIISAYKFWSIVVVVGCHNVENGKEASDVTEGKSNKYCVVRIIFYLSVLKLNYVSFV